MIGFKIKQRLNYRNYIKTRLSSPSKGTWKNESVNSDSRGCQPVLKLHSYFQRNSFFFQNKWFFSAMAHSYVRSVALSYTLQGRGLKSDIYCQLTEAFFGGYGPHLVVKSLFFFFFFSPEINR